MARTKSITRTIMHPNAAQGYGGAQYAVPAVLSSASGALEIDLDKHQDATTTLTKNTTVSAPTNMAAGKTLALTITGASTYTLAWNAAFKRNSDKALPAAPAAGKRMTVYFRCDGTYMWLMGVSSEV